MAFFQAVACFPINTGNETLGSSLPVSYDCYAGEAVAENKMHIFQTAHFEDEPTKNEVRECCQVLVDSPSVEGKGEAG